MTPYHVALVSDTPSVSFEAVANVSAAVQKQVTRDFGPLWHVQATVDPFARLEAVPVDYWPVIIRDDIEAPGAAGFHTDKSGQPFSLVQADANWALTVSHETLEMLADPFGNRTIAGAPPPQASGPAKMLARVVYLVEVCDPPEDVSFAYPCNGVLVSDFITPHFYDPTASASVRYSFGGHVRGPHRVLNNGYVSFGDPLTDRWYQVVVRAGRAVTRSLGVLDTSGRSLRETIDRQSRRTPRAHRTGTRAAPTTRVAVARPGAVLEAGAGRAARLRTQIRTLLKGD